MPTSPSSCRKMRARMSESAPVLSKCLFEKFTQPGSRLAWLQKWLLQQVWTAERYDSLGPIAYLQEGERWVNEVEEVITAAAPRVYDEFLPPCPPERDVWKFLESDDPTAAVVFDGLSVREVPVLLRLAEQSGLTVQELGVSSAAVPSETVRFVEQRLRLPRISPSNIVSRGELREAGIAAHYFGHVGQRCQFDEDARGLLLWSAFPDYTYKDSGARFAKHFEEMHNLLQTAWMNTVQQIPAGRRIVVTSDHGYVFFGPGHSANRTRKSVQTLTQWFGGERFGEVGGAKGNPPEDDNVFVHGNTAMIRGRVQTHPPGPSSSKLYKHGGLSIMEMVTPWIVLESS